MMFRRFALAAFVTGCLALLASCNGGITPDDSVIRTTTPPVDTSHPKRTGIAGTLSFRGTRPPADSLLSLRVVFLTRKYPLDSITAAYLSGSLVIGDTVSRFVDSVAYLDTMTARRYSYIAVAQQFSASPVPFGSWRAVGVYAPSGNDSLPGTVDVIRDSVIEGVNINVDYDHLPPQ